MKIITIIVLSALALAAAALLSSGCADSLIMGDDFGIGDSPDAAMMHFKGGVSLLNLMDMYIRHKSKATYLLPDSADESKIHLFNMRQHADRIFNANDELWNHHSRECNRWRSNCTTSRMIR